MATHASSVDEGIVEQSINKYFPYLLEVRRRLLLAVCIMIIAAVLGFIYYDRIITFIVSAFSLQGINIVFTSPFQYIELAMSSALLIGLVASIPFLLWQLVSFLKPALTDREYRLVLFMLPLSVVLFSAGFAFGLLIMKYVVLIFQQSSTKLNVGNFLDISRFLSSILTTSALMGLAFQFPLVLAALVHVNIINNSQLAQQRPWAYLSALFFAILLPPTDILSAFLLSLPLILLFEFTLVLNKLVARSAQRR